MEPLTFVQISVHSMANQLITVQPSHRNVVNAITAKCSLTADPMSAADPLIDGALSNVRVIKHGLPRLKALMAVRAVKPHSEMANPSLFSITILFFWSSDCSLHSSEQCMSTDHDPQLRLQSYCGFAIAASRRNTMEDGSSHHHSCYCPYRLD